MKRELVLIAGALLVLVTSFYVSTRLIHPPATAVATLKQGKLDASTPFDPPITAAATVQHAEIDQASCSARLGSVTRCT
jgi:hypothetical protein